ncbi:MAG: FAD-dependent oxidoreductase, partial [Eubacteriales bacterium]|nr:FAD-dependent oxidoreductase [Eubacteriales bacterium]
AFAYAAANSAGLQMVASFVGEYDIGCDFERVASFVYTRREDEKKHIETEMRACEKLGIKCRVVTKTRLPFAVQGAIAMDDQAQFHPLKYLYALADIFIKSGGSIHERSKVLGIIKKKAYVVKTQNGSLTADTVVLATNYPPVDFPGLFFLRLHQERSYIIGTDAGEVDVSGMYINAEEPVNSIRMHDTKGAKQLLLGGYGHKTGKEDDAKSGYSSLEGFLRTDFAQANACPGYHWSAQDCVTLDGMPYVGAVADGVYVATGYAKWGMTNSAAAAMMIADSITGSNVIDSGVREQFSPKRISPAASAKNFLVQGADTFKAYTAGNIFIQPGEYADVAPGKGAVLRIGGKAQAVYRDKEGGVHAYKAHCTHMGCPLEYNEAENSFDCPCHGSRFSMDGEVIEGPAKQPLEKIKANE